MLDGILVAAVDPVQLKTEVDVVPHVVFAASMVVKTLHRGSQREGGAQSRSESLAAANTRDHTVHMGCRLEQEHNDGRSIRLTHVLEHMLKQQKMAACCMYMRASYCINHLHQHVSQTHRLQCGR